MTYTDYINNISFKLIQPEVRVRGFYKLDGLLTPLGLSLEAWNTRLPERDPQMDAELRRLLTIPRMSTFALGAIINRAVSQMKDDECFVNVGVWNGYSFLAGMVNNPSKTCIGIDNFSQFGGPQEAFRQRFEKHKSPNHFFHDMDYKDYFRTVHKQKIGFYNYDGEHSYENQLEGLRAAEPFFSDDCMIFVDDTNLPEPRKANLDFIRQSSNKYEILLDRTTCKNGHPTFWNGVMILQRIP